MIENPFCYGKIVDDPYFFGRKKELEEISFSMQNGTNLILYAPRRSGKSSLVVKALKALEKQGHPVVYIDFFKVTSREKFIELYARELIRPMKNWEKGLKWIKQMIRGIRPVMGLDPMGQPELSLALDPAQTALALEDVINIPARTKKDKRWIVVFDEFQEVEKLNGDSFEKELRSWFQHHQGVSYIFLGSQRHMLLNMFSRKDRAFYNFGKLFHLANPTDEESVAYILERFRAGGFAVEADLAEKIVRQAKSVPYYLQYLCAEIWEYAILTSSVPSEVYENALNRLLLHQSDYFQEIRDKLTSYQFRLLTAIASEGYGTYETAFIQRNRIYPASSLQKAYQRLVTLDLLEKNDNQFVIPDPFFERWIRLQS